MTTSERAILVGVVTCLFTLTVIGGLVELVACLTKLPVPIWVILLLSGGVGILSWKESFTIKEP